MRQQRFRHELAEREAAGERDGHAGDRDAQRRLADLADELEVGLHPGQQQQQQDAELRDAVEHGFLLGRLWEDGMLQVRPQHSERRWAEQDAPEQHAHDGGLADTVQGLAQEAPHQHQRNELGKKDDFRRTAFAALGGKRGIRAEDKRGAPAGEGRRADAQDESEDWHAHEQAQRPIRGRPVVPLCLKGCLSGRVSCVGPRLAAKRNARRCRFKVRGTRS
jgi:hypothetical protein